MSLAAGRLRHRVDIQAQQSQQDTTTGAMVVNWVTQWEKVPAAVEPMSARELIAAQAQRSEVSARVIIRRIAGLTAKHRIKHGERIYNIHGVIADADSGLEYMTLPVSEGVNDGR